ncbi:type II toxin-antitoxin system HipA family toxin [Mucilaginibacter corticis]|uniref:Type II toxin-antitoxin system HipA family toxin n=1 Tax=Mucilaginibacter corticis TaxID=2597670 RepID=A0A556MIG8_9SPHI|nr:type II toxin-antitoxin system HipA family toxin [Mucilaginibacter corticis]TSJ39706.1 type II toxin-antitoxin system HipA family toxin [Mucilaginibacter corticis]
MVTNSKTDIYIYADWIGLGGPQFMGTLKATQAKTYKTFGFQYDPGWLKKNNSILIDPEILHYDGPQFPVERQNFGVFSDSMPDSWGRKLMQRRASQKAKEDKVNNKTLYEIDFLLGVHDFTRMGALRYKLEKDGPFLDNDDHQPAPPWTSIRDLQYSAEVFEEDTNGEEKKWLELLLAPGSSLGGARPKANVVDEKGALWIAKFPSANDITDKAAWEYLAYLLAGQSGVKMAESKLEHVFGKYRTFFTKRFDREGEGRIHFSSAMTMTNYDETLIRDYTPSYLEIADFVQNNGSSLKEDLHQLWRRIVFNIAISNTDDHLRNHGFLLSDKGWRLSPAYDLNPSVDKSGLGLNIDMDSNALNLDLARSVGAYFQLNEAGMDKIIEEVRSGTENWRDLAQELGIPRHEQEQMAPAFTLHPQFTISRKRGR